jgi:hypothetical protein
MVPIVGLGAWFTMSGHAAAQTSISCTLSGTPPNISLSCGPSSNPAGGGAPNCAIQVSPSSPASTGGAVSITAVGCSTATTWKWRSTGGQVNFATTSQASNGGSLPDNSAGGSALPVTFYVQGCDSTGACGTEGSQQISVPAGAGGGGGGGTAGDLCGNYRNVTNTTMATWNAGFTQSMVVGGVIVVPFTPGVSNPQINWGPYSGSPITRTITISRSACDFRKTLDPSGANGPITGKQSGIGSLYPVLIPGVQYYINIADMMWSTGLPVCSANSNCGDNIVTIR